MTQKTAFLVLACAALLAMVTSVRPRVNTYVAHATIHDAPTTTIWADCRYPIPPIPPGTGSGSSLSATPTSLADGGYPIPPIPPGTGSSLSSYLTSLE
jgi:hypothetical protein